MHIFLIHSTDSTHNVAVISNLKVEDDTPHLHCFMAMVPQHYCIESLYAPAPISHIFIYFPLVPLLRYYFSFSLVPLFSILSSYLWRLIYGVFWRSVCCMLCLLLPGCN
jgi:hypothetical protein